MNWSTYEKVGKPGYVQTYTKRVLTANNSVKIIGRVKLLEVEKELVITADESIECLLRIDFLKNNKCVLNLHEEKLYSSHFKILTKRLLEYADNQRESCRRQVEILMKELAEVRDVAETKTRECIALVDERECLARELENAEKDIRKLKTRVTTEQTSKKVIQRRLEAINAQSPFSRPPNFYELLFLPQGATTSTIQKHFKTFALLCHPDKGGREDLFKIIIQVKNLWKMRRPVIFMTSTGLKKQRNI